MSNIKEKIFNSLVKIIAKSEEFFKDKGAQVSIITLLLIKELLLSQFFINNDPVPQIYVFVVLLTVFFLTIVANPLFTVFNINNRLALLIKVLIFVALLIYGLVFALKLKKENDKKDINKNKYDLNSYTFFFILISMGTYLFFNIFKNLSSMTANRYNEKSLNWSIIAINIVLFLVIFFNNLPKNPKLSDDNYDTQNKTYVYTITLIFIVSILAGLGINGISENKEYMLSFGLLCAMSLIFFVFGGLASFNYYKNVKDDYNKLFENNLKNNKDIKDTLLSGKNKNTFTSTLLLFFYIILAFTTYSSFGLIANLKPLLVFGLVGLIFVHFLWVLSGSYMQDLNNKNKRNVYTNEVINSGKPITSMVFAFIFTLVFFISIIVANKKNIKDNKVKTVAGLFLLATSFFTATKLGNFISKTNSLVSTDDDAFNNIKKITSIIRNRAKEANDKINSSEFNNLKTKLQNILTTFSIKPPTDYTFTNGYINIKVSKSDEELTTFKYIFKNNYSTFTSLINDINNQMLTKYKSSNDNYIINVNMCFKDDTIATQSQNFKRYFTILIKNILKNEGNNEYSLLDLSENSGINVDITCSQNVNDFFQFGSSNSGTTVSINTNKNKYNEQKYLPVLGDKKLIKNNDIIKNLTYITTSNKNNIDKLNIFFDNNKNLIEEINKDDQNNLNICCQYAEKHILNYDILFDLIVNIDDKGNQTFFNPDPNAVDFYDKYNEEISTTSTDANGKSIIIEKSFLKKNIDDSGDSDYFKNHINNFLEEYNNYILINLFKRGDYKYFKKYIEISDELKDKDLNNYILNEVIKKENKLNIKKTQFISRVIENTSLNNNTNLLFEDDQSGNIKTYIQNPNIFMNSDYYINEENQVYDYINLKSTKNFINSNGYINIKDGDIDNFKKYINNIIISLNVFQGLSYKYNNIDLSNNNMFYKSNNILRFLIDLNNKGYSSLENTSINQIINNKGNYNYTYYSFLSLFMGLIVISYITFKYDIIYDKFFIGGLNKNNIFNNVFGTIILIILGLAAIEWKFSTATNSMSRKQVISNVINVLLSSIYMSSLMVPGYIKKILIFLVGVVLHSSLFTIPSSIFENPGISSSFLYIAIILMLILSVTQLINPITSKYKFMYIILGMLSFFMILNSFPISIFKNDSVDKEILEDVKEAGNKSWSVLAVAIVVGLLILKYLFNPYRLNAIRFKQSKDVLFARELIKKN